MTKTAKPFGSQWQAAMRLYAAQQGVRNGSMAVLSVLIQFVDFDSGQSRPGRAKIKEYTGASDRNLDRILKELRDRGLILPLAYLNGGRNRATCYGFAVPAWHTVDDIRDGRIIPRQNGGGIDAGSETENPRQIGKKPPPNCPKTPAKLAVPSGISEISRKEAAPSRREDGPSAFEQWDGREPYSQYLSRKRAWEKEGACAPAENEKGEKILPEAPRIAAE